MRLLVEECAKRHVEILGPEHGAASLRSDIRSTRPISERALAPSDTAMNRQTKTQASLRKSTGIARRHNDNRVSGNSASE